MTDWATRAAAAISASYRPPKPKPPTCGVCGAPTKSKTKRNGQIICAKCM